MCFALRHAHCSKVLTHTVITLLVLGILVGFAASTATAGTLADVRGNDALSDGQIRELCDGMAWTEAGQQQALRRVQDAYIQSGFLFASLRFEMVSADSAFVLLVDEGPRPRFGKIRVTGAEHFSERTILQTLHAEHGRPYSSESLQQGIDELLERYDHEGFPFAQVWVDSMQLEPASAQVTMSLYIVEGGVRSLTAVEVEGDTETKEELIVKLSGLSVGGPYNGAKLRESYMRLASTGIFDEVAYPTVQMSPDGDGVQALLRVVEPEKRHSFSGAFGYADREVDQEKILSGFISLELNNIGGTLKDLNVFWRNDGAGRSETRLGFQQRFFLGRRLSLGLSLEQVGLDTLYTWQSVGVESSMPVGRLLGGLLSLDVAANGDRNTFSTGPFSNSLRWRLRGGYTYVLGDQRYGSFVRAMNRVTFARKELKLREDGPDGNVEQTILELGGEAATILGRNLQLVTRLNYRSIESPEAFVPLSEQYYVGGAATLRGYRENQFHGRRVAWSQFELLMGRDRRENGYLFVDGGYILQEAVRADSTVARSEIYRAGYGFGLRTQSPVGNIDISFGVGQKMSLRQTKVHVLLNRRF